MISAEIQMVGELRVVVEAIELSSAPRVRLRLQLIEPGTGRPLIDFGVKTMAAQDEVTLIGAITTVGARLGP